MEGERKLRVFGNRVLRKIFGPKGDWVTGEWRKLNEKFNDLHCSPNIIRVIKSRKKWAWACSTYGERRGAYRFRWGNLRERDHLQDQSVEGRIILRWIFRKWDDGTWTGLIWVRTGKIGGLDMDMDWIDLGQNRENCECGNKLLVP
jgi:hypothetical protein